MDEFSEHVKKKWADGFQLQSPNDELKQSRNLRDVADVATPILRDSKSQRQHKDGSPKMRTEIANTVLPTEIEWQADEYYNYFAECVARYNLAPTR